MTASAAMAALLPVGDAYLGDLDGPTDADWIRAELTAGAGYLVTIAARDPDGDGPRRGARDTILEIYNEQQELIASMDDQEFVDSVLPVGGFHPQLDFTPASGGVHYFRVSSFISPGKDNSGGYRLELGETRPAPDPALGAGAGPGGDPNGGAETSAPVAMVDDGAEASRLEVGGVHLGVLNGPSDSNWITAALTGGTTYILAVASRDPDGGGPLSGAKDTKLEIYNGQDELVASMDDQALVNGVLPVGGMHPRLSFTPSADGDYFFRVSSFIFPGEDYSGGYQLELTEAPAPPPAPDPDPDPAPGPDADPDPEPDPAPGPDPDPNPAPDTDGPTDDGDGDPEPEPGGPLDDWIKENIGDDSDGRGPGTQPPPGGWPDTIPENTKLSEIESETESEPDPDPPNPNPGPAPAPEQQEPPYVLHHAGRTLAFHSHHPLMVYELYPGRVWHNIDRDDHLNSYLNHEHTNTYYEKALTGAAGFAGSEQNPLEGNYHLVYAGGKKAEAGYIWYGHDETETFNNRLVGHSGGPKVLVGGYGDDVLDFSGALNPNRGHYLYGDGLKVPALTREQLRKLATGEVPFDRTRPDNGPAETFGHGNDTLTGGPGDDYLYGAGGNDTLRGGGGRNRLDGGPGDDTLISTGTFRTGGREDRDALIGGPGRDLFDVSQSAIAHIWDFQDGADRIKIGVATETNRQWEIEQIATETSVYAYTPPGSANGVRFPILADGDGYLMIVGVSFNDLQFEVVGGDLFIV